MIYLNASRQREMLQVLQKYFFALQFHCSRQILDYGCMLKYYGKKKIIQKPKERNVSLVFLT